MVYMHVTLLLMDTFINLSSKLKKIVVLLLFMEYVRLCKGCGLNHSVFKYTKTDKIEDGYYNLCKKCREK